jgi:hypothetical protein
VQNAVAVLRNLAAIKKIKSKVLEWILILMGVVLGAVFNNRGIWGWFPIVANFEYSVVMFTFKDNPKILKLSFVFNAILFAIFSFIINNYVGIVANTVIGVTTVISLFKEKKV